MSLDPNAAASPDSGVFGLPFEADQARVHLIGVPFDATTSYRRGAARGPEAILRASRQVDLFDLVHGNFWEQGIWMAPADERVTAWNLEAGELAAPILECGGLIEGDAGLAEKLARVNEIGAEVNAWVEQRTAESLDAGHLVGIVGGDHAVPLGSIRAHAERRPGLGLLHFDAHADLREAYEGFTWSHASILSNVLEHVRGVSCVVQAGIRDLCEAEFDVIERSERVHTLFDHQWAMSEGHGAERHELVRRALEPLPREVYLTFDVDALDPGLCPNTGTPVPGGFSWNDAMAWLEELVRSGRRIVGFDLVEVAPGRERPLGDGIDEIIGARLLYRLIGAMLDSNS